MGYQTMILYPWHIGLIERIKRKGMNDMKITKINVDMTDGEVMIFKMGTEESSATQKDLDDLRNMLENNLQDKCPQCAHPTPKYCTNCGSNLNDESTPILPCRVCKMKPRYRSYPNTTLYTTHLTNYVISCSCGFKIDGASVGKIVDKWNKMMGEQDDTQ